jgi:F-type H+-transporting ATPase subunit b
MHIDWFVFFAQIVNFLILVYLLKRFLYGRIINAIDAREAKIANSFAEAEKIRKEAQASAEEFDQKNRALKETYDTLMNQAVEDVEKRRKELMDQARATVDEIRQRWQETILREKESFIQELRTRTGREVYAVSRRVLSDLADADLESKMADVFIRYIGNLKEQDCISIRERFQSSGNGIIIQSAFTLPVDVQQKINEALKHRIGNDMKTAYEISEDIVSGIELRTQGHKIAWSLNDYLEKLDESFSRALQEEARIKA